MNEISKKRAAPINGRPTTYRGKYDMAGWWQWSEEVEDKCLPTFRPFIKAGDLVFDIGANQGRKTYLFRKLGAKVVAVDPLFAYEDEFVPEFYWKFGQDKQVMPVGRAVTPERQVELSINKFMPYVSSIDQRWMTVSAHGTNHKGQPWYKPTSLITRNVRGITLDGLIGIYGLPRFVKVDVEGFENEAVATLSTPVAALNMEFHRDWIPSKALKHMDSLGAYQWTYVLGNGSGFEMEWTNRAALLFALKRKLTEQGPGSWGDIYGRLID